MAYDLILRRQIPTDYSRDSSSPPNLKTTLFQILAAAGAVAGSDYLHRRQFEKENAVVRAEITDSLNMTQRLPAMSNRRMMYARKATQP